MIAHRLLKPLAFASRRMLTLGSISARQLFTSSRRLDIELGGREDDLEERNQQTKFEGIRDQYLLPSVGHKVFLVQPRREAKKILTAHASSEFLEEARALVDSLETWTVVEVLQVTLKSMAKDVLFTPGVFEEMTQKIRMHKEATAVFVNWPILSGIQLASLQKVWRKPVYDRFTLVLQIFRLHAQTRESRLQVALAEIPFLRSRISGFQGGNLPGMSEGSLADSISEKMPLALKLEFLDKFEDKLKQKLKKIEGKREFLRTRRRQTNIPLVTVIGYTNAGKTALIRELTGDENVRPRDKLFATLDTSNHGALLSNNLRVIFVDTIGFLSNIPTTLVGAFKATLKDCMDTDLLIHVVDMSHHQYRSQIDTVNKILKGLDLPDGLMKSIIQIANKSDRVSKEEVKTFKQEHPHILVVSCETRDGLDELKLAVQDVLQKNVNLARKKIKVTIGGAVHDWLQELATVEQFEVCSDDENKAIITVLFTPSALSKFQATFQKRKPL